MYARKLSISRIDASGARHLCPIHWMDNFAMREFSDDTIFYATLPVADGLLEVGNRVSIELLQPAMEGWFRSEGYLKPDDYLEILEIDVFGPHAGA